MGERNRSTNCPDCSNGHCDAHRYIWVPEVLPPEVIKLIRCDPLVATCYSRARIENLPQSKFLELCIVALARQNDTLRSQALGMMT